MTEHSPRPPIGERDPWYGADGAPWLADEQTGRVISVSGPPADLTGDDPLVLTMDVGNPRWRANLRGILVSRKNYTAEVVEGQQHLVRCLKALKQCVLFSADPEAVMRIAMAAIDGEPDPDIDRK